MWPFSATTVTKVRKPASDGSENLLASRRATAPPGTRDDSHIVIFNSSTTTVPSSRTEHERSKGQRAAVKMALVAESRLTPRVG